MKNLLFVLVTVFGLTACGGGGGSSSGGGAPVVTNKAPTASFSFACSDLACSFDNTSTDSDGTVASSSWNFGDGATATTTDANHTFGSYGSYTVSLTVTDNDGATGSTSRSVTVSIDVNTRVAVIDFDDASILLKQDFNHRPNDIYTVEQIAEDMCVSPEIYYDTFACDMSYVSFGIERADIEDGAVRLQYYTNQSDYQNFDFVKTLKEDYQELYLTYRVKYSGDWGTRWGTKANGLAGTVDRSFPPTGGVGAQGADGGFSSRYGFDTGSVQQYVYWEEQSGQYGDSYMLPLDNLELDTWYTIEMRVKMNTPGEYNGEVETWVNGVSMLVTTGFSFSASGSYGINTLMIDFGVGGNIVGTTGVVYYDDVVLSTQRVVSEAN